MVALLGSTGAARASSCATSTFALFESTAESARELRASDSRRSAELFLDLVLSAAAPVTVERIKDAQRGLHRFTGRMAVSIPGGRRPISELEVGDLVWVDGGRSITKARVSKAETFPDQHFGIVVTSRDVIEATAGQRVFTNRDGYRSLGEVGVDDAFVVLDGFLSGAHRGSRWIGGGVWAPAAETATLYEITLDRAAPFFVQGVLVKAANAD